MYKQCLPILLLGDECVIVTHEKNHPPTSPTKGRRSNRHRN